MTTVDRANGSAETSQVNDTTIVNITIQGNYVIDADMLDRVLQFVLMQLDIDTAWLTLAPTPVTDTPPA